MGIEGLAPAFFLLLTAVLLDAVFGDPQYSYHPVRLIGKTLNLYETFLRHRGWDGYGGGCLLFLMLAFTWVILPSAGLAAIWAVSPGLGSLLHILTVYLLLALRDLFDHVRAVGNAARDGDLDRSRKAIGLLVGRDIGKMDLQACRRAAIESLSENFVDGFMSALFWYALLGIPGLLAFKLASTMDSMIGYKSPRYLRFGWCGARLDDLMNYIPARLAWLALGLSALPFRGLSARKGWRIGFQQHDVLPGPNPGWSEATMAGVLQRRLIGPIWKDGALVTEIWLGDGKDPEAGSDRDLRRAMAVIVVASAVTVVSCALLI
jgi:adenosylcobinamide-phosphate synthase